MKSSDIQKRLAENLKRIRKQQKLTQFELAEKAGISDETIKNIELCKTWTSEKNAFADYRFLANRYSHAISSNRFKF
ncbi:MAG: helix-turn-helix domain-containing protein [Treponema succinifaciens]|nr:MAG: helix-turn-helix domain-containing protein [Treponema succinifaciens]